MTTPLGLDPTIADPVCGQAVSPDSPGSHQHNGTAYRFCGEACHRRFAANPDAYLGGPRPAAPAASAAADGEDSELRDVNRRLAVAIVLGVVIAVLAMTDTIAPGKPLATTFGERPLLIVQAVLATVVVFWCGGPLLVRGWRAVRTWRPDMFTLVGLGVGAAYLYSVAALAYQLSGAAPLSGVTQVQTNLAPGVAGGVAAGVELVAPRGEGAIQPFFETAAGIVVLVLVGQLLELRARQRTGDAVRKLLRLTPQTARVVLPDGREEDLPLELVRPGELVRVRPNERVPVDGIIQEGTTNIDESMLSGEPVPIEKGPGMTVLAGTQNALGTVTVEAVRVRDDTVLAQIARLVGRAGRPASRSSGWPTASPGGSSRWSSCRRSSPSPGGWPRASPPRTHPGRRSRRRTGSPPSRGPRWSRRAG